MSQEYSAPPTREKFQVGSTYTEKRIISGSEVELFAKLTGDHNPVHFSDLEAQEQGFKRRIAHGLLSTSYFSAILANKFPGPGCIYLSQDMKFHAPVYLNEEITYKLSVIAQKESKPIFSIETLILNDQDQPLVSGHATIRVPRSYL